MDIPTLPAGWLHRPGDAPSDDLDLAVLLLNSVDLLDDPPDRLTVDWYRAVLTQAGHPDLAAALRPADLNPLRRLRERLRPVFTAGSPTEAATLLNPLLAEGHAIPMLTENDDGTVALRVAPTATGYPALAARLPAALAASVAARISPSSECPRARPFSGRAGSGLSTGRSPGATTRPTTADPVRGFRTRRGRQRRSCVLPARAGAPGVRWGPCR